MAEKTYKKHNNNSPESDLTVTIKTTRNKNKVKVSATVKCAFTYNDGYLAYNGAITFTMGRKGKGDEAQAVIKSYSNKWYAKDEKSRTKSCSFEFEETNTNKDSLDLVFGIYPPAGRNAMRWDDKEVTIKYDKFVKVSAPTGINGNPNPCDIRNAATISWWGAKKGSMGTLSYDIDMQSTRSTGGWTSWKRVSTGQTETSYQTQRLKYINIEGITPYPGIKYQFRVRSRDSVSSSSWIIYTLNSGFISPSSPTSAKWSATTVRLHPSNGQESIGLVWSGATGGSGDISYYEIVLRANHSGIIGNWDFDHARRTGSTYVTYFFPSDFETLGNFKNNDQVQAAVRTVNSWGMASDWIWSNWFIVRGSQIWIKVDGTWREGECYIKDSGTWKEGEPWIKVDGSWRESS